MIVPDNKTLWTCPSCGIEDKAINFPYWTTSKGCYCHTCELKSNEGHMAYLAWIEAPEGQAELIRLREEMMARLKKDLDENYWWYEGNCADCGKYDARYVRNEQRTAPLHCGCRDRADREERIGG